MRLDKLVADRGLARSRTAAAALIRGGRVRVDDRVVERPSIMVGGQDHVVVDEDPYVSRAGHKLAGALAELDLDVAGLRVLDAGASTGGFSQVLLRAGACEVIAVDVGHGQLVDEIRDDPRVTTYERVNVRDLTLDHVDGRQVDLIVADLSFISLITVLPALAGVVDAAGSLLLMVKPQFEVGRRRLDASGVVRDPLLHVEAVAGVANAGVALGWYLQAVVPSRLPGPSGNREFFVHLAATEPDAPVSVAAAVMTS
ncbi:MAG TPA: TlyA family RNA methyltransferase [Microlunatus sp.]|nr:TlyA family RNA methyltransferase [Microlunatus sp.]